MRLGDRSIRFALAALAVGVLTAHTAHMARAEERPHVPGVDWERMVIKATGAGAPDLNAPNVAVARLGAERAARLDAMRSILETLQGVRVSSGSTAGGVMDSDSAVKATVEGLIRSFGVVDTRYYADGGVEVDVEMSLTGELGKALLPPGPSDPPSSDGEARYTGLIIDASGKGLTPSLAPRVLDERDNVVYGSRRVSEDAAGDRGVVLFRGTLEAARQESDRVGESPLVLRPLEVKETDVVITNADAVSLSGRGSDVSFLGEGRVIFVVDGLGGADD